jgi:single-stranded-DNA-specific exonuclease
LGLNISIFSGFLDQLKRLGENGPVHYIDHHPIDKEFMAKLEQSGVDLYHSTEECTAILVYKKYEDKLRGVPNAKILACCGAITDHLDSQPLASKLVSSFDRQFLLYEATVLSFSIATIGRNGTRSNDKLVRLAEQLSAGKLPHEIREASSMAQQFAARSSDLMNRVRKEGKRMKNFAYFKTTEAATGNVANFLIGAFDVPVGVALRVEEPGFYEISLRESDDAPFDLGRIVTKIAAKLNASGGGHPKASGARIKSAQLQEFLSMLDQELSR